MSQAIRRDYKIFIYLRVLMASSQHKSCMGIKASSSKISENMSSFIVILYLNKFNFL